MRTLPPLFPAVVALFFLLALIPVSLATSPDIICQLVPLTSIYACNGAPAVGYHVELINSGKCHGDVQSVDPYVNVMDVLITENIKNCPFPLGNTVSIVYNVGGKWDKKGCNLLWCH